MDTRQTNRKRHSLVTDLQGDISHFGGRTMYKSILIATILLLLPMIVFSAGVEGFVLISGEWLPVSRAFVIFDADHQAQATENGYYIIEDIDPGTYQVEVQGYGFETLFLEVTLEDIPFNQQDFYMTPLPEALCEGYVYDSATNEPLGGVLISFDTEHQVITELNGYFEAEELRAMTYSVQLELQDYEPLMEEVSLDPGTNYHEFFMTAATVDPVTLTLTPTVVWLPEQGGNLDYGVHLVSMLPNSYPNVRYWTEILAPDGNMYGALYTFNFNLLPFMDVTQTGLVQSIPTAAPAGEYVFYGHVGYTNGPRVTDSFEFTKQGAPGGVVNPIDWNHSEWQLSVEGEPSVSVPDQFSLGQAWPNPFNPSTTVQVSLPEASSLQVVVFNSLGQQVAVLNNSTVEAGTHGFTLDAQHLASGLYFIHAAVPGRLDQTQKVMLVR